MWYDLEFVIKQQQWKLELQSVEFVKSVALFAVAVE